ncbi:MAG: hypothetical protein RIC12_01675 [Pirellulales bacterium]
MISEHFLEQDQTFRLPADLFFADSPSDRALPLVVRAAYEEDETVLSIRSDPLEEAPEFIPEASPALPAGPSIESQLLPSPVETLQRSRNNLDNGVQPSDPTLERLPEILDLEQSPTYLLPDPSAVEEPFVFTQPFDAPLGFAGPSSIVPFENQADSHFVPMEDRWRSGFPEWDRYDRDHPLGEDYPYKVGHWWDPYNQNVLKGDYPIAGQHTFLNVTLKNISFLEFRQLPVATTPFESTVNPFEEEFFGDPDQFFYQQYWAASVELFHGDAGFKEPEWRIKATPIFNINYLDVNELGVVNPNVLAGTTRLRDYFSLEEWFVEKKLADLSTDFDFLAVRGGSQPFVSDFRGLIFADINRSIRLFGTRLSNREQFNVIWFDQTEKDTNSLLNTFDDRHQNTVIANYFRQDTIWPGYTMQLSFHYNRDGPSFKFDNNDFLARPDPAGVFAQHRVESYYLGWAGDGHINRFNISHAFYYAFGEDSLNPIAGRKVAIDAYLAACEISYDRDWARFRASIFYASGDDNATDSVAQGFDGIFENQNFAGGIFSYWNRQSIRLFGVGLTQQNSLFADLSSSKGQGQPNFVNPGLLLANVGFDFDLTPKLKWINNANYLWFDDTDVLQVFTFQADIDRAIGADLSSGIEYRPLLNNNIIIEGGVSGLIPGDGFRNLYNKFNGDTDGLAAVFLAVFLEY